MNELRTRTISGRSPVPEDHLIVAAIADLPPSAPNPAPRRRTIGIANDDGLVYRMVSVFSLLELLHIGARLNCLGFRFDRALQELRGHRHGEVFSRAPRPPRGRMGVEVIV